MSIEQKSDAPSINERLTEVHNKMRNLMIGAVGLGAIGSITLAIGVSPILGCLVVPGAVAVGTIYAMRNLGMEEHEITHGQPRIRD